MGEGRNFSRICGSLDGHKEVSQARAGMEQNNCELSLYLFKHAP